MTGFSGVMMPAKISRTKLLDLAVLDIDKAFLMNTSPVKEEEIFEDKVIYS
jgi:hypothetical protein